MHHAFKANVLSASQDALKDLATASFSQAAAKAAFFMPLVSCPACFSYPDQMDQDTLWTIAVLPLHLLAVDSECILLSSPYFFLLYPPSIPYTRSVGSHTCALGLHACQRSSANFSLSVILQMPIRSDGAECSPAYEYDLDMLLLLWSLLTSFRIAVLVFFLRLPWFSHKSLACDTLAQIRCDIYNSILYVLNLHCHLS